MDELPKVFLERLRKTLPRILQCILFGSRARGDFRLHSDYDLLVVVPEKNSQIKRKLHAVAEDFWMETGKNFSLKIMDTKQFQRLSEIPTPFLRNVLAQGVKIG